MLLHAPAEAKSWLDPLPEGVHIDRLIRALVVLVLFNAAYMAETVRGYVPGYALRAEPQYDPPDHRWRGMARVGVGALDDGKFGGRG